jgi:EmrB/QacA subfamily drug resistance transporter
VAEVRAGQRPAEAAAAPPPILRATTAPGIVLAVASLGVFMAFVDATIVNIAFPSIERSFPRVSLSGLSWVLNAYNIVFAALMVAAGRIADVFGRRRVFRWGVALFTVASGACAAAPSPALLVLARVVQAIGAAVLVPCSLGLVLQAFPEERRAHAVAMWTAVAALAAGVGPALGGVLVSASNWRLAFLANLPVGVVAFHLAGRTLIESRMPGRRRIPDLLGALVLALGVGALTLGIVEGPDWGWTDVRVLVAIAASLVLLALFVERCRRHQVPLVDLDLFRIRNITVANGVMVVTATGFFCYTLCNVLFLTSIWRYSVLDAGLAITPGPIVAAIIARPASGVAERVGYRFVLFAGGLLWASGLIWFLARVGTTPDYAGTWLPGMVLLGLGAGVVFPNLSSAAVAAAPGGRFATATAINSVARQLGAVLGVALLVAILGTPGPGAGVHTFRGGWWLGVGCFGFLALGGLAIGRARTPGQAAADAETEPSPPVAPPIDSAYHGPQAPRRPRVRSSASPAEFLRAVPLFAGLPDATLDSIVSRAHRVRLRAGEPLFSEGDAGDSLYLLRAGRMEVLKEGVASSVELERGAVVGELAVLAHAPRSASVRAVRDCELLQITSADFNTLMAGSPEIPTVLARTLGAQLQQVMASPPSRRALPATIALVPLQEGLPVRRIGHAIGEALSSRGRVERLDGDGKAPDLHDPLAEFGPLVDRYEDQCDQVLLLTAPLARRDPWTEFCLARADRVLALTAGGPAPKWLGDHAGLRGCELAGYAVAPGSGVLADWISVLEPAAVHRLAGGGDLVASAGLTARRLGGRAVGVVLSGGGARAFAHLGVLEELIDAGLPIDRVGGVSMGAFVGGQLAAGRDVAEIDARCYEEWVRHNPINDYTLPRKGLIRGHKGFAMVKRVFGDAAIEELPKPFYCASTDIRRSELVIHRHGSLTQAISATISLPMLAPPRMLDGRALIDGSLLDNLPIAPMAQAGEGPVIAIDVKPRSGGGSGRRRSDAPPPFGETIARVLQLASADTSEAAARHADFVIRAGVEGVGLLEFHQIDVAREAGRRAARDALDRGVLSLAD